MTEDLRDVLQLLRFELNYLEQGGYNRDRESLGCKSPFQGTIVCINFANPERTHACRECLLYQFVPEDKKTEEFPCHYIPLGSSGETVASLIDSPGLVPALEQWLRNTIARLDSQSAS